MSEGRPVRRGGVGLYEHRAFAAPVRLECFRHEGPVIGNVQPFRGLDWLRAHWVPTLAGGDVRAVPVDLPELRPGETAALAFPFRAGASGVRLRVTTARDEPGAPRGTVVCLLELPPVAAPRP
ncbi:hypothetical protein ACFXAZ_07150 [Streptomyces sp. NPDC059477]|uniref:hypothetical protein n=1 Tax=Streptomyces sp. NPDC059477 TaxID=3346847 RepID=UPI0036C5F4E5